MSRLDDEIDDALYPDDDYDDIYNYGGESEDEDEDEKDSELEE